MKHFLWFALVLLPGCAGLSAFLGLDKETIVQTVSTLGELLEYYLPFPWNGVVGTTMIAGAEAMRRSFKNSVEGKMFGALRKKKEA